MDWAVQDSVERQALTYKENHMADIQIPQRTPLQGGPPAPPYELVQSYLNRPYQNIDRTTGNIDKITQYLDQQQKQKIGAFEAGGPALMNSLYGGGQQSPQPQPQPQQQPQTQNDIPETIRATLNHPVLGIHAKNIVDFKNQMAQNETMGKYGQTLNVGVKDQLSAEQALMGAEQFQQGQDRQQSQYETSRADEESRFQRGQGQKVNDIIASAGQKQSDTVDNLRKIDDALAEFKAALSANKPSLGANIKGRISDALGGKETIAGIRVGSNSADAVNRAKKKLALALYHEVTKSGRIGPQADEYINSLLPTAKNVDWKDYIQGIESFRNSISSGMSQNLENAKTGATSGDVVVPQPKQQRAPQVGQVYKGHVFLGGDPSSPSSWRKQ